MEKGREEVEEGQEKKMDNQVIRGIVAGVPKEADTVGGGVTRNTVSAALSANAGEDSFKKSELGSGRKDDLKRIGQSFKAEVGLLSTRGRFWRRKCHGVRQWEEISKEVEKIEKGKMEGKSLQVEGVQRAPELLVSQV